MKHWFVAGFLAIALLVGGAIQVSAQDSIVFDRVQIDLWPEYDQPSMLVIYHITLAAETPLPANISLRIPTSAAAPYTVAFQNVDGMLLTLDYTTQADGDWVIVNFVALSSVLQVEYYDPGLAVNGDQHNFTYIWPADAQVRNLTVNLQQPRTATEMTSTLTNSQLQTGSDGLQYYFANYGLVEAGRPLNIQLSYTKSDDALSVGAAPVTAIQPTGSTAVTNQATGNDSPSTPLVLGLIVALIVLTGCAFWITRNQMRQAREVSSRRRHAGRASLNEVGFNDPRDATYCSQCGRRASSGDLFCRSCGNTLKS